VSGSKQRQIPHLIAGSISFSSTGDFVKTLDRSKPFSEMYGDDEFQKHRYMQNGVKFDDAGQIVWRATDPQGNEAAKIKWDIVPYTRGRGLDLGCGPHKAFSHFIGVDNNDHARRFGWEIKADVSVATCEKLDLFADKSMDFVFSSHLLEHIEAFEDALREWWRVIKPGGPLVLYLPHKEHYPNIGQPGARFHATCDCGCDGARSQRIERLGFTGKRNARRRPGVFVFSGVPEA
jgi:SAM-dependent methyltransferase